MSRVSRSPSWHPLLGSLVRSFSGNGSPRSRPPRTKLPASISTSKRRKRSPHKEQSLFGIKPVDYSTKPPIVSPPPPPPRGGASRFALPFTLFATLSVIVYIYRNNKNDSFEYWRAMQEGQVVMMGDDDEDNDDDQEYDEDDE